MVALEPSAFWILDRTMLRRLAASGGADLANALDAWISALSGLAGGDVRKFPRVMPGADYYAEAGNRLGCASGVGWFPAGAPIHLLGVEHDPVEGPVPVVDRVFGKFAGPATGSMATTASILANDDVTPGLARLFRAVAATVEQRTADEERQSLERIDSVRRSELARDQSAIAPLPWFVGDASP